MKKCLTIFPNITILFHSIKTILTFYNKILIQLKCIHINNFKKKTNIIVCSEAWLPKCSCGFIDMNGYVHYKTNSELNVADLQIIIHFDFIKRKYFY